MRMLLAAAMLALAAGGCADGKNGATTNMRDTQQTKRYFTSPESAVETITDLLRAEDWETLASYYDLSGSDVDPQSLRDGSYFIRTERPEVSHPAGFWRYKQPFAPGFKFQSATPAGEDRVKVTVAIEIDEGGGMVQRGLDTFTLKKSAEGYQLLPKG